MANAMAIASAGAGLMGAVSTHNAGVDAQQQAYNQAAQTEQEAKQERAVSHYKMARMRDEQRARASENQLNMSEGGTGDDPSSVNLMASVAQQETLEQLMEKALADQSARNLESQATQMRVSGKQQRKAATLQAFGQAIGSATSWFDKYGPGGGSPGGGSMASTLKKRAPTTSTSSVFKGG